MDEITMQFQPVKDLEMPNGCVAYLRLPLKLTAMQAMNRFIEQAYGKGCMITEQPKGWLRVSTPTGRGEQ